MAVAYRSTNDPQEVAANQRALIDYRGNQLGGSADREMEAEQERRRRTAGYLDAIMDPLARGEGGYSPDEIEGIQGDPFAGARTVDDYATKIEMSPEERQAIETGAGITAGNRYRSAIGSMERGARAAGMSPMGVGAYRARMERDAAGEAADAITKAKVDAGNASANRAATVMGAKVGAQNYGDTASSDRATTIGNTRLNQQGQGLDYYRSQNQQASDNANQAANRAVGVYGTQADAGNTATKNQMDAQKEAAKQPSTFQKVMGGVSGAMQLAGKAASFLEDGGIIDRPTLAVVGENGPEVVAPLYRANPKVRPSVVTEAARRQPRFYGESPIENGSVCTNPIPEGKGLKPRDAEPVAPAGRYYRAYADASPSAAIVSDVMRRQPRYYGQAA